MAIAVAKGTFLAQTATGNQTVTITSGGNWPASTTPKAIFFWSSAQNVSDTAGAHGGGCMGAATSSTSRWTHAWHTDQPATSTNAGQRSLTTACLCILSNGTPTTLKLADFVSFGADQFVINWTANEATANIVVHYLALSGSDLTNVATGSGTIPTTASTNSVTGLGWQPDSVLFVTPYMTTETATDSHTCLGFAARSPSITQGCVEYFDNEASTMDCGVSSLTTRCIVASLSSVDTTPAQASLSSFDAGGFSLTWTNPHATAGRYFYLALKGGQFKVGVEVEATTNSAWQTIGVGFQSKGLIAVSTGQTSDGSITSSLPNNTAMFALGATNGTNEGAITNIQFDGHADSQARRLTSSTRFLSLQKYTSTTTTAGNVATFATSGQADAALDSDGFTLTWSSTDGTARRFIYFAIGDAAAGGTAYTSTVAGSLTSSGTAAKQARKGLTGGLTSSGLAVKRTDKTAAGSLTPSGLVATARVFLQSLAGTLTTAGTLSRRTTRLVAGTLTTAGTAAKQTTRSVVGTLTPAGTLAKRTGKAAAGTLTSAGSLARRTFRALAGALTPDGLLNAAKQGGAQLYQQAVGGALALSGVVSKRTARSVAGTLLTAGVVLAERLLPPTSKIVLTLRARARTFTVQDDRHDMELRQR